ncbi:MAG: helix-turn-helix domain-containing protein [Caldibacillus sp.]
MAAHLIRTHFTNQELANMTGASRETVSRILTELKKGNRFNE